MKKIYTYEIIMMIVLQLVKVVTRQLRIVFEMMEIIKDVLQITKKRLVGAEVKMQAFLLLVILKLTDMMMTNTFSAIIEAIKILYRIISTVEITQIIEVIIMIVMFYIMTVIEILRFEKMALKSISFSTVSMVSLIRNRVKDSAILMSRTRDAAQNHLLCVSAFHLALPVR